MTSEQEMDTHVYVSNVKHQQNLRVHVYRHANCLFKDVLCKNKEGYTKDVSEYVDGNGRKKHLTIWSSNQE